MNQELRNFIIWTYEFFEIRRRRWNLPRDRVDPRRVLNSAVLVAHECTRNIEGDGDQEPECDDREDRSCECQQFDGSKINDSEKEKMTGCQNAKRKL